MTSFHSHSSFSSQLGGFGSGAPVRALVAYAQPGIGKLAMAQKAGSVYGGAGGRETRISMGSASSSLTRGASRSSSGGYTAGFGAAGVGGSSGGSFDAFSLEAALPGDGVPVTVNEKQAMQNLNDRLAKYLERVHSLEEANATLEAQIRDWGVKRSTVSTRDVSSHRASMEELRAKILDAATVVSELSLQIDNTRLSAEDFRTKYENELILRQSVEADISGLKKIFADLGLAKSDLEMQLKELQEEIISLNKSHEEEKSSFVTQLSGQVQVDVEAAPAVDLNGVIAEIREQYEAVVAKNRRNLEAWFGSKQGELQQQVQASTESLQASNTELKDSQANLRSLELELQSMHSMKATLEGNLADTEARYTALLCGLQGTVTGLEAQLSQLRADIMRSSEEYRTLLDIKSQLEMEIAEYRRLLDGEVDGSAKSSAGASVVVEGSGGASAQGAGIASSTSTVTTTKTVVTKVQEVVGGKVVSSASSKTLLHK